MNKKKLLFILIFILAIVYGIAFTSLTIQKYKSFSFFEWEDDAANNQLVYNLAVNYMPHQTVFIYKYFFVHFTPIFFLIALFYKICPHIFTWYFLMSFSFGLSAIVIYLLSRDMLKDEGVAFILSLSYLLYSPLHYVNLGALNSNIFSLPLLFLTFYFLYKRKFIPYIIFMVISCTCKEDIPLVIFLLGIYQIIRKYPKKWWITTLIFSAVYFAAVLYILDNVTRLKVIPFDFIEAVPYHSNVGALRGLLSNIFFHTKEAASFIFTWPHFRVLVMLLLPLLLLPLFSLEAYIPLVMIGEVFFKDLIFKNDDSYYLAPIIPFLFIALIFVFKKIQALSAKKNYLYFAAFCILSLCFLSNFGRNIIGSVPLQKTEYDCDKRLKDVTNLFDRRFYTMDDEDNLAWEFINMIPKNASVTASGDLLVALSSRKVLYEFGQNEPDVPDSTYSSKDYYPLYNSEYILVHTENACDGIGRFYVFVNKGLTSKIIHDKLMDKYRVLRQKDNFILLRRIKN